MSSSTLKLPPRVAVLGVTISSSGEESSIDIGGFWYFSKNYASKLESDCKILAYKDMLCCEFIPFKIGNVKKLVAIPKIEPKNLT